MGGEMGTRNEWEGLIASASEYGERRHSIPTGLASTQAISQRQDRIRSLLGASLEDWNDWLWQIKNVINDPEVLSRVLDLDAERLRGVREVGTSFRWAISPYYASLIDPNDEGCPMMRQSVPNVAELEDAIGTDDPMSERLGRPVPNVTRRYPDRVIITVTNQCGMFCRHCQRRRRFGESDEPLSRQELQIAVDYVAQQPDIRDVLITGGDPLTLADERLDWLLCQLDEIPHLEMKRIGTRLPVTLPQRVTPELSDMLSKHHPLYVNTQFNHPMEVTKESMDACDLLAGAGVPLGNQTVLLKGVNDCPHTMKKLHHELLKVRVKPYYIFHAKPVKGTAHFITPVETGIEIMEHLRGFTSGLAIPTFVVNMPGGAGKVPIMPDYVLYHGRDHIAMRSWEGDVYKYPNRRR